MKKLLVASVYYEIEDSPNFNKVWLRLQRNFLKAKTHDFDFVVYLNNISRKDTFKNCEVIGESTIKHANSTLSHRHAIREVIEHFRSNKDDYDCFLLLDSDCFPIRQGWLFDLKHIVREKGLKFAAIVRPENGELYPHPAATFILHEHIQEDLFQWPDTINTEGTTNILEGHKIRDTGSANNFWQDGHMIGHPLIRTNVINLHPIFAGIYGDMFYHHGLGSRVKVKSFQIKEPDDTFRTKSYWDLHGQNYYKDVAILFDMISEEPKKFINNLRGNQLLREDNFLQYFDLPFAGIKTFDL